LYKIGISLSTSSIFCHVIWKSSNKVSIYFGKENEKVSNQVKSNRCRRHWCAYLEQMNHSCNTLLPHISVPDTVLAVPRMQRWMKQVKPCLSQN
jgi:hypothetical protein